MFFYIFICIYVKNRNADPGGYDPDPTYEKTRDLNPDRTVKKKPGPDPDPTDKTTPVSDQDLM